MAIPRNEDADGTLPPPRRDPSYRGGRPSSRRYEVEDSDVNEVEAKIKELVEQNCENGEIEQVVSRWDDTAQRFRQVTVIKALDSETILDADGIGRRYGSGKFRIQVRYKDKNDPDNKTKTYSATIWLDKEYDQYVTPAAPKNDAATTADTALNAAMQIAAMTKPQNGNEYFNTMLELQKENNAQMQDLLKTFVSKDNGKQESQLDIAKAIGELSKLNNSGETTKMMMEMSNKMTEMIVKASDKPDTTPMLLSALAPVVAALASKPKDDSMILAIAKLSETSNQNMMAMMQKQQEQSQQFMQLMIAQMNASAQQTIAMFQGMQNNKGDNIGNALLREILPQMIAGAKPKDTMEELLKLKQLTDELKGDKDDDDDENEVKDKKSIAQTLVEGLLAALPHIVAPAANVATVRTLMKQLPEQQHLQSPEVRDMVSDRLKSQLSVEELQILQYRTGVDFGVPKLTDEEFSALIQGAAADVNQAMNGQPTVAEVM